MPDIDAAVRSFASHQAAAKQAQEYTYPTGDSPTLALTQPTAAEHRKLCKANATSWRGALSIEAYLRREERLIQTNLAKDAGVSHWVLIDTAAPEGKREVLAGCETLRKHALVVREGGNGQVEQSICHGVGNVFTPDRFRGRGYGARMMRELGEVLGLWQVEKEKKPCLFSILYSDIGKKFYAKHGWKPYASCHINLPTSPAPHKLSSGIDVQITTLSAGDLPALCTADEALQRQLLLTHSKAHPSRPTVALIPDIHTIEWHHARENFVSNELYSKSPLVKGAMATVPSASGNMTFTRVWAIWTRMWYNTNLAARDGNVMYMLRLVVENEATRRGERSSGPEAHPEEEVVAAVTAVLQVAQKEAHEWNMAAVQVWNPLDVSVREACRQIDADIGGKLVDREQDSIASLRWYGGGVGETEAVYWLENEKYGWC